MQRTLTCGLALTALLAALLPVAARAQQPRPSFDCAEASGEVESMICADAALVALDRRLAEVWAAALEAWPDDIVAEQRAYQRGWIGGRNECWKADDVRACAEESYRTRIVELQIKSGQLIVAAPHAYSCAGAEGTPLTATFYRDTDPPSAVLTYGQDQVIAFLAPAASGPRYAASNVEFREHQGEVTLEWFGSTLICRPVDARGPAPALQSDQLAERNGTV